MPAEIAARAFDPVFTTKGKGTGLGLSQVYGMARQAGGVGRIEARRPRGTTVSLLLVAAEVEGGGQVKIDPVAGEPAPVSRKILVVDDDAEVRQFLTDSLDSLGFEVATAPDGETGLALMSQ